MDTDMYEDDIQSFEDIIEELLSLYKLKNKDYGCSFSELFKRFGLITSVVRLNDKVSRITQLVDHEASVKDESIEDSLRDLANYAIMTIIELNKSRKQ